MGGVAGPIQQTAGQVQGLPQQSNIPGYAQPYVNKMLHQRPQQPNYQPYKGTGGVFNPNGNVPQPIVGAFADGKGSVPTPQPGQPGFQSPYANYGFDPGFQSYLDQRYQLGNAAQDMGQYSYDPTNQMFTLNGAFTAPGTPTQTISLADMQNRYQHPYQPPTMPLNKPGTNDFGNRFNPFNRPNQPPPFPRPNVTPQQPSQRGPADRNMQSATTQGLAGLAGMMQGRK
jgi:hypothetical protein